MGTRNTTTVTINGKKVIAQYGQWDGYPTYHGAEFLHFFESEHNIKRLIHRFETYIELKSEEFVEDYMKSLDRYMMKADTKVKDAYQQVTANSYFHRDWGVDILYAVAYGNSAPSPTYLVDYGVDTWGTQEGNYRADIITDDRGISCVMTLEYHGYERTYNLDNMPRGKAIDEEMKAWEEKINNCEE